MWLFKRKEHISTDINYSDYLPIGSIIKIKNDSEDTEYVISGYLGKSTMTFSSNNSLLSKSSVYKKKSEDARLYYQMDYEIIPFNVPFYDVYTDVVSYIKSEDIKEVVFKGYSDDYRKSVLSEIDQLLEGGEL